MVTLTQKEIATIEKDIDYIFNDKTLLEKAFTHSSIANLRNIESNERLEFFGDSILSFIVSEKLYTNLLTPSNCRKSMKDTRNVHFQSMSREICLKVCSVQYILMADLVRQRDLFKTILTSVRNRL